MADSDTLEQGDIFFLFRPTVDTEHPHDLSEVQHFYLVLRPRGASLRLCVIGKKRLPEPGGPRPGRNERNWGFVDMIAAAGAEIERTLRETSYDTKTAGTRTQGAARPAGEGAYALHRAGRDTHLVYALALPDEPGPVQHALGIGAQGAFAVTVKNPRSGSANSGMLERHDPDYPPQVQALFEGRRWTPAHPSLLDRRGAEFLLVAVHDQAAADLDPHQPEDEAKAGIFTKLRMARSRHPAEPLFTGEWA